MLIIDLRSHYRKEIAALSLTRVIHYLLLDLEVTLPATTHVSLAIVLLR